MTGTPSDLRTLRELEAFLRDLAAEHEHLASARALVEALDAPATEAPDAKGGDTPESLHLRNSPAGYSRSDSLPSSRLPVTGAAHTAPHAPPSEPSPAEENPLEVPWNPLLPDDTAPDFAPQNLRGHDKPFYATPGEQCRCHHCSTFKWNVLNHDLAVARRAHEEMAERVRRYEQGEPPTKAWALEIQKERNGLEEELLELRRESLGRLLMARDSIHNVIQAIGGRDKEGA